MVWRKFKLLLKVKLWRLTHRRRPITLARALHEAAEKEAVKCLAWVLLYEDLQGRKDLTHFSPGTHVHLAAYSQAHHNISVGLQDEMGEELRGRVFKVVSEAREALRNEELDRKMREKEAELMNLERRRYA